jgi:predicted GNAT family acetyltransferase
MSKEMRHLLDKFNNLFLNEDKITLDDKNGITRTINKGSMVVKNGGVMKSYTVYLDGEEIIGASPQTSKKYAYVGSKEGGLLNVIIPNKEDGTPSDKAFVMNISIPENLRGKGIGAKIYQALANKIRKTIISSADNEAAGIVASQTPSAKSFWQKHKEFKPQ